MVKILETNFNPLLFDRAANHPLQSWAWGEARKKMNVKVVRIGEYRNNELANVFQLTIHKIPYVQHSVAYLPRSVVPSLQVLKFLHSWGKENKIIFIKIEPYEDGEKMKYPNLHKSSHPLFTPWTQILDLTKSEEELLENMHPKTRYNVRLASKKGVTVRRETGARAFEIFSNLYFETTKRQKYFGHNLEYHKSVWESLQSTQSHILIAYFKDIPLAAYELFYFKKRLYYVYGGTSHLHRNLMASNLLMWEAIKIGKSLGADTFDMWGSLPPDFDQTDPWSGFTRFKQGYGTKFKRISDSYDLVINTNMYRFFGIAYFIREHILKAAERLS